MGNLARRQHEFSSDEKRAIYRAIYGRRDVREHFTSEPLPDEVLARLLDAAHHGPSVGFMQPWNFIIVKDAEIRRRVKALFEEERERSARLVEEPRRSRYVSFKLEGILESGVNVCITCDRTRSGPFVIGRTAVPETDIYSVCCAIQNLWLAARAEGIGVGWVSILSPGGLKELLGIPSHIVPVAYLCLGYVTNFRERPDLESAGWLPRLVLSDLVFYERWGEHNHPQWTGLHQAVDEVSGCAQ